MNEKHLERRYRRLLAWYPREHRERNGEEMLGVLMAGAGDRRRPGLRESADLLWGAVRVRWHRTLAGEDRADRRAAVAIVSLLAPIVLLTGATTGLHEVGWFVLGGGWSDIPWLAAFADGPVWVVWLAVAVLALFGRRRAAAIGAWLATIGLALVTAWDPGSHWWAGTVSGLMLLSVLAAVALTVPPQPTRALVGWGRLTVLAVAVVAVVALGTIGFHVPDSQVLAGVILAAGAVIACGPRSRAGRRAALILLLPSVTTLVAATVGTVGLPDQSATVALAYGIPLVLLAAVGGVLRRVDRRA
jgi:hypothetical protein